MEFKIKKEIIYQGLSKIQGITGKKTNIPITSNVFVTADDGHLSIIATDLEIAFHGKYKAEILSSGSGVIPSRKLYEIIKDFPSNLLVFKELENKWIQIADKDVEYNIVGMDPNDFPGLPDVEGAELFEMDVHVLRDMIEKTIYAVLSDEARPHLAGVFFETIDKGDERRLRMVSTDGHRLSKIDQSMEKEQYVALEKGVIIPKSGIIEVLRLLEGGGKVHIGFKDRNFIVRKDSEGLIIRLIEGEFPDYDLVIPKKNEGELRVKKEVFVMMLKRMSILSSDKYRSVSCKINNKEMEAKTTNPDIGESREVIPVSYNGDEIEIAFNPRYFIDAIATMKSEELIIRLSDEATPCLLEGDNDPNFLSVIMPMRV
ncbi:MAG: DNA polymerase III subunit beta [Deltaproteobacteria bacterium]|nr:DNA polymerase III subunit beta [Deltaproteobacteria bacterium]